MSEWKLKDCCLSISDGDHLPPPKTDSGIPFITISNIDSTNHIDFGNTLFVPIEYYEKLDDIRKARPNDIIYSVVGSFGKPVLIKDDRKFVFQRHIAILRPNSEIVDSRFLYYVMLSRDFYMQADTVAIGAAQRTISLSSLRNMKVELPPIPTQHRIATILSRYDTLIENSQKQIKLLEEAAQRLYKEWFVELRFPGHENTKMVDGLPEGWERKAVSQLGEYLNGFAFKPSDWHELGRPIIKIKEMGNGVGNDTPRNNGERVPAKYLVKAGDLLFSWSATLMVIVWSGEEGWLNQHLFKVTPSEGIGREFLLQSLSNAIEEFQNLTTGSTMKHIQRNKLDQVFVNVPNDEIMELYNNVAEKVREEILHLSSQIRLLAEARDRLLPRLMGGEMEV
ncbi:MAG: restriction endonuclease subunit S [Prevotella sp.]|nr:restriction endonuclease subunit S [Prevotella sp.]MBQ5456232.1 restriction endonuclease subunit S [Prevotella sp.]